MSATIFTGWHLLTYGTATNIIFVGAAVLVLRSKVRESRDYMAAGDAAFASAEQRDAAFEETRNKPWYWPTDPHVTGELLAVEHHDVPAIAAEPHHDDEDAPAEDTDRKGMWRVLLGLASDLVDRVHDWLPTLLRQWSERDKFGSGEQATSADPFAELLAHVEAKPIVLDPDDEAALQAEHKAWKAANPPTNHGPDGQRHWNDVTAMHGILTPGRHAKMPINPVPKQRGEVQA